MRNTEYGCCDNGEKAEEKRKLYVSRNNLNNILNSISLTTNVLNACARLQKQNAMHINSRKIPLCTIPESIIYKGIYMYMYENGKMNDEILVRDYVQDSASRRLRYEE